MECAVPIERTRGDRRVESLGQCSSDHGQGVRHPCEGAVIGDICRGSTEGEELASRGLGADPVDHHHDNWDRSVEPAFGVIGPGLLDEVAALQGNVSKIVVRCSQDTHAHGHVMIPSMPW